MLHALRWTWWIGQLNMFVLGLSAEEGDGWVTCDEICEHVTSLLTDWEESKGCHCLRSRTLSWSSSKWVLDLWRTFCQELRNLFWNLNMLNLFSLSPLPRLGLVEVVAKSLVEHLVYHHKKILSNIKRKREDLGWGAPQGPSSSFP